MLTLNLVNKEKSNISYKIIKYPDGQQHVAIESFDIYNANSEGILIKSRMNSFLDLELIVCATQSLKDIGAKDISLGILYILGSRSDRRFSDNRTNYIKNVIAPIINSQNYTDVSTYDPHSDVLEACINNFESATALPKLLAIATVKLKINLKDCIIISPDAGGEKRVYKTLESKLIVGKPYDIITASKKRNLNTGEIERINVPLFVHDVFRDIFIIDDICDGGRTFIELAKAIQETRSFSSAVHPSQYGKVYLIVTHGIFSSGFEELSKYFDGIFTTNSIKDIDNELIYQLQL